jgi:hypothetical protein
MLDEGGQISILARPTMPYNFPAIALCHTASIKALFLASMRKLCSTSDWITLRHRAHESDRASCTSEDVLRAGREDTTRDVLGTGTRRKEDALP